MVHMFINGLLVQVDKTQLFNRDKVKNETVTELKELMSYINNKFWSWNSY